MGVKMNFLKKMHDCIWILITEWSELQASVSFYMFIIVFFFNLNSQSCEKAHCVKTLETS